MQIDLTGDELRLLAEVLDDAYSDLREEIYKTEDHDFKRQLKEREDLIKSLIEKLPSRPRPA